jgi:hypothetical protein
LIKTDFSARLGGASLEVVMQPYALEIEIAMKNLYDSLNERDRRRYAGIEALKLGPGGREYIARVLGCSRRTVSKGAKEVSGLSGKEVDKRIRRPGGGRKPYSQQWEEIDAKFLLVLRDHTAGDPMDENVRWTDLSPKEIRKALREDHGIEVSLWVVRQLLKKQHYRRRKAQKKSTLKQNIPHRNEQFENIAQITAQYRAAGNPILSMDTKKKSYNRKLWIAKVRKAAYPWGNQTHGGSCRKDTPCSSLAQMTSKEKLRKSRVRWMNWLDEEPVG